MQPKWSKGYSRLGLAKFKAGDLAGAMKAYSAGLALDAGNTQIADGLAEVRFRGAEIQRGGGSEGSEEGVSVTRLTARYHQDVSAPHARRRLNSHSRPRRTQGSGRERECGRVEAAALLWHWRSSVCLSYHLRRMH
jgi:hypothetical protein